MPDDWVHCLFTASIIGMDYESKHCWVNEVLDHPARFLGGKHRILLHDLETARKLGTSCWWAGFVAALHIDIDGTSTPIKRQLKNVVKPFKNGSSRQKQNKEYANKTGLMSKGENHLNSVLRNAFLKIHKKIGIRFFIDEKTSEIALIIIEPNNMLKTTWDYVNQSPPEGIYVDDLPYNELPPTIPRFIPHPDFEKVSETAPHTEECLDEGLLRNLFADAK